eukprot:365663-Chlamydomonas_euryale.AAC.24
MPANPDDRVQAPPPSLFRVTAHITQFQSHQARMRDLLGGETALCLAADMGRVSCVDLLLKCGAAPDAPDAVRGMACTDPHARTHECVHVHAGVRACGTSCQLEAMHQGHSPAGVLHVLSPHHACMDAASKCESMHVCVRARVHAACRRARLR